MDFFFNLLSAFCPVLFLSSAFLGTGGKFVLFWVGFFCNFINRMKKTQVLHGQRLWAGTAGYVTAVKADKFWWCT